MTAPTVEAAIHELMDLAWNVVYDLLEARDLLGDGLFVEEYTGIHSWLTGPTRIHGHSLRHVAVLFQSLAGGCHRLPPELLGADDPPATSPCLVGACRWQRRF